MCERTRFSTGKGLEEMFCTLTAVPGSDFASECEELYNRYISMLADFSPVWVKLHLSDITNQAECAKRIFSGLEGVLVLIGQPPANGARLALEAWHLPKAAMHRNGEWNLENFDLHFFNTPQLSTSGSDAQMHEEFAAVDKIISARKGTIENNLLRTWIYCRDVDNNYAGLVKARREYFDKCGLTADTHYIASTGIEGQSEQYDRLVRMDSLAVYRHEREQIQFLYALENLSPTSIYGVTFERATRMIYGDRSHYYISGTASIDKEGNILHLNDVGTQTERVADNIEALLAEGEGTLAELKQATVYLRDAADYPIVKKVLERRFCAETGLIFVRGPVCRPGWLVEIEGIAVNNKGKTQFKNFI